MPLFSPTGAFTHAAGISVGSSAAASASVRPDARRPIISRMVQSDPSELSHHRTHAEHHRRYEDLLAGAVVTPANVGGATPMTVKSTPLIRTPYPAHRWRRPARSARSCGRRPRRDRDRERYLRSRRRTPSDGWTPSSGKKFAVTTAPLISRALPFAVTKSGAVG